MHGDSAHLPDPTPEPEEVSVQFEIATFEIKFAVPAGFDYSSENLTAINNLYINPHFVKASQRLVRELGDAYEIYVVKLDKGSLSIRGGIKATVKVATALTSNAFTASVLASALTIGANTALEEHKYETLYYDTIQKLELMFKEEADTLKFCPNPLEVSKSPFYSPVLQKYEMLEFLFCPSSHESLVNKVEKTLDNYHRNIGKI